MRVRQRLRAGQWKRLGIRPAGTWSAPLPRGTGGSLSVTGGLDAIPGLPPVRMPGSPGTFPGSSLEREAKLPGVQISLARDARGELCNQ